MTPALGMVVLEMGDITGVTSREYRRVLPGGPEHEPTLSLAWVPDEGTMTRPDTTAFLAHFPGRQTFPSSANRRRPVLGLTADEELTEVSQGGAVSEVYPRTLLYLISNALEGRPHTPLLGMQRSFPAALVPEGSVIAWTSDAALQLDHKTHGFFVHNPTVRHWIDQQLCAQG